MIGVVSTLAHGHCRHCGHAIVLHKSDIERDAHWAHEPLGGQGVYRRECPGTQYAEPIPEAGER